MTSAEKMEETKMSEAIGKRYGTWQTFTITWPINKKESFSCHLATGRSVGLAGGRACARVIFPHMHSTAFGRQFDIRSLISLDWFEMGENVVELGDCSPSVRSKWRARVMIRLISMDRQLEKLLTIELSLRYSTTTQLQ